ncbi:ABC transporter ATP-binding protein [Leucobacter denitrificans]|uniref:ABC transporter ATP-binding protein n=1 Tax=Leucobacter denitrificans TaxID=683042 RepID=A0A7G9S6G7_9MICO|nr:ABC transporter ATP-binding protein [Leucobacter denitrificans]QNN63442.1 ABC transporter ATP-binding protein [Leucobacter denitrificans]
MNRLRDAEHDSGAVSLEVESLKVAFGDKEIIHGVSFSLAAGERLGIIGGSGSGKTITALAIAGLLPTEASVSGSVRMNGRELIGLSDRDLSPIRGERIAMVFQEPKTALSPFRKLGKQMTAALALHYRLSRAERRDAAMRLARQVGLKDPERMVRAYPHEVSGGQRQRAAIAAAVSASPGLLLADEPTSALDVTVQRGILELFTEITESNSCSLICITHDIAVVNEVADRVLVFADGGIVEQGTVQEILERPQHTITQSLIAAAGGVA